MRVVGVLLGIAIGLALFGHVFLQDRARDKYEIYCLTAFTHEPRDANGCDHDTREWHAP